MNRSNARSSVAVRGIALVSILFATTFVALHRPDRGRAAARGEAASASPVLAHGRVTQVRPLTPSAAAMQPSATGHDDVQPAPEAKTTNAGDPALRRALRAAYITTMQSNAGDAYALKTHDEHAEVSIPGHGMTARFASDGTVQISHAAGRASVSLRLSSLGRGATGHTPSGAIEATTVDGNHIEHARRGGVREWYKAGPLGVEQGFVIAQPPAGSGEVELRMDALGSRPTLLDEGNVIALGGTDGDGLRYGELYVKDAAGREVPSRLAVRGEQIALVLDDKGAQYPLYVDPLVWSQQATLTVSGLSSTAQFGASVAVDGDTAVVGAPGGASGATLGTGAAYVFVRNGSTWTLQASLPDPNPRVSGAFGGAVAISGNYIAVRALNGVYIARAYIRTGTTWNITAAAGTTYANGLEGCQNIAISGTTIVCGEPSRSVIGAGGVRYKVGAMHVYVLNGTDWSTKQATLAPAVGVASQCTWSCENEFGYAVAIDGNYAVATSTKRYARVFLRSGTTWTEQATINGPLEANGFGDGVALSGATLVVGAPWALDASTSQSSGGAYVYVRSASTWSLQRKLFVAGAIVNDEYGSQVGLYGDQLVVRSAPRGRCVLFTRSGTTWTEGQAYPSTRCAIGAATILTATHTSNLVTVYSSANQWTEAAPLPGSTTVIGDRFGTSAAASGSWAAVGASHAPGSASGAVYMFRRETSGWVLRQTLTTTDPAYDYAASIALHGTRLIVGSPHSDGAVSDTGAAYLYELVSGTWRYAGRLLASDGASEDGFGRSVAISGSTAVVGAHWNDNASGVDAGAAYVFLLNSGGGTQQAKLAPPGGSPGAQFGKSVAIDQNTLVAGAPGQVLLTAFAGAAYVFTRSGTSWTQQVRVLGAPSERAHFGSAVALSADTLLVGAPYSAVGGAPGAGAVYVFQRGTSWLRTQKLTATAPSGVLSAAFGGRIALLGTTAVIAAFDPEYQTGNVYAFQRASSTGTFWQQQRLQPSEVTSQYGASVALAADKGDILIGAPAYAYGTTTKVYPFMR